MHVPVLDGFSADNLRILALADDISRQLGRPSTKRDLEQVAFEIIDGNDRLMRPHFLREERSLLAVVHEHLADQHPAVLERAGREMDAIREQLLALRRAVELNEPLRPVLEETEFCLRRYVDHQERVLIPWARRSLGNILIEEMEQRLQAKEEEDVSVRIL